MSWSQSQARSRPSDTPVIEYLDRLYSYARILVRNLAEAENLVQETYAHANESIGKLPASDRKRWLFTVLRDIWLRGHGDHDAPSNGIVEPSGNLFDPRVHKRETDPLRLAIQELPTELREMIFLREYEGLSPQEIAVILNCPVETVTPQLSRARGKLRAVLAALNAPSSPQGKKQDEKFSGPSSLLFCSSTELARRAAH